MKLSIPTPCPADWDQMKIGLRSRHCLECQKNVIDFSKMSRKEILLYLIEHQNEQTCGRFYKQQLDHYQIEQLITLKELKKLPTSKAFLLLALIGALLVSCQSPSAESSNQRSSSPIAMHVNPPVMSLNPDSTENRPVKTDEQCILPVFDLPDSLDTEEEEVDMQFLEHEGDLWMGEVVMGLVLPLFDPILETDTLEDGSIIERDVRVYHFVDEMPYYPDGIEALQAFMQTNYNPPKESNCSKVEGKVYVEMIVEANGALSNVQIRKSFADEEWIKDEVLRLIQIMPEWVPGTILGKPVRVSVVLPFNFKKS